MNRLQLNTVNTQAQNANGCIAHGCIANGCIEDGCIAKGRLLMLKIFSALLLVAGLFASSVVQSVELIAEVDRETVIDGEMIVLYIEGKDIPQLPDTSSLNTDFRITQSGQSNSQTIINGKRSRTTTIRLELQPKKLGSSVIPAFTAGGVSSDPITIEVVARGTPGVEPRDKVFAELSVSNPTPYVQEQVILSLKLFDDGNLSSADPVFSGTSDYQVEQLPLGREQIVERNGVQYRVNTFRYALFPQQSGEVTIDEIRIPASVRDQNYGSNLMLFNSPSRRIELNSDSISLSVKPRAEESTSSWWLPVKALELEHGWSSDITDAKVGEPYTLTLELRASGATSTQLPEITVPDVPGLKIYVDNPEFGSNLDGEDLVSVRREKWSVIPNRSGQLTLPEIEVKWWDSEADKERRAFVPAQTLIVAGDGSTANAVDAGSSADNSVVSAITNQGNSDDTDSAEVADNATDADNAASDSVDVTFAADEQAGREFVPRHWLWLSAAAVTAWLATLLAWWWSVSRRKNKPVSVAPTDNSTERKAWRKVQSVAASGDMSAYRDAVLEWAQYRWTDNPVHNLPDIGVRLGNHQLTKLMQQADQQRYSAGLADSSPVSIKDVHNELEDCLRSASVKSDSSGESKHALPQL